MSPTKNYMGGTIFKLVLRKHMIKLNGLLLSRLTFRTKGFHLFGVSGWKILYPMEVFVSKLITYKIILPNK
jgi:hypothetical protein